MSKKVIIIVSVAILFFMSAIGGGFFMLWSKMSQMNTGGSEVSVGEEAAEEEEAGTIGPMYSLDSFVVNLAEEGSNRYLRVTMELELDNEVLKTEIEKRLPQVRNAVLMILPSKVAADIKTVDGKVALRDEVMDAFNNFLTTGEITNIYFTEFVIQ